MNNQYEIKMNDGVVLQVEMTDYNARRIANQLNNQEENMVALGDVVVQRYSVVRITPVDAEITVEEEVQE